MLKNVEIGLIRQILSSDKVAQADRPSFSALWVRASSSFPVAAAPEQVTIGDQIRTRRQYV